jgi:hypothetical protein
VLELAMISDREGDVTLPSLAGRLLHQDRGTVIASQLRATAQRPGTSAVTEWLATCADSDLTTTALDTVRTKAPAEPAEPGGAGQTIVVQTQAYLSLLAALIEIFIEAHRTRLPKLRTEPATIDDLANVRTLLATDPHLALHTITRIRQSS